MLSQVLSVFIKPNNWVILDLIKCNVSFDFQFTTLKNRQTYDCMYYPLIHKSNN